MKLKVAVKDIVNEIDGSIFSVSVSDGAKVTLPDSFSSEIRSDLVKLAEGMYYEEMTKGHKLGLA